MLKKHNILLIADEVICGFGRTGKMFGQQTYGFQPDIASFAKGITSGYIPLGGVAVSDEIFDVMSEPDRMFMHGFTYSGHPVACAVGLRNIQIIEEENLPANAGNDGRPYLLAELHRRLGRSPERRQHPRQGPDAHRRDRRRRGHQGEVRSRAEHRRQADRRHPQAGPDRPRQQRRHRHRARR